MSINARLWRESGPGPFHLPKPKSSFLLAVVFVVRHNIQHKEQYNFDTREYLNSSATK